MPKWPERERLQLEEGELLVLGLPLAQIPSSPAVLARALPVRPQVKQVAGVETRGTYEKRYHAAEFLQAQNQAQRAGIWLEESTGRMSAQRGGKICGQRLVARTYALEFLSGPQPAWEGW